MKERNQTEQRLQGGDMKEVSSQEQKGVKNRRRGLWKQAENAGEQSQQGKGVEDGGETRDGREEAHSQFLEIRAGYHDNNIVS